MRPSKCNPHVSGPAEAKDLKQRARLEDLHVWEMEKVKESKRLEGVHSTGWPPGERAIRFGMCTWVVARSCPRTDAIQKARKLKAEGLGLDGL